MEFAVQFEGWSLQCILVWFQLLLVNPTQNVDHVAIDMRAVAQVNGRVVTRISPLQLWLSVAWTCWAWVCDTAQQATRWCRKNAGALWWLVPTRVTLFLAPFLVTWRPWEVLPGSGQRHSRPQRPASHTPRSPCTRIPVRHSRRATSRLPRSPGATAGGAESGAVGSWAVVLWTPELNWTRLQDSEAMPTTTTTRTWEWERSRQPWPWVTDVRRCKP